MQTLAYRYENEYGKGPYTGDWVADWDLTLAHNHDPLRPAPYSDGLHDHMGYSLNGNWLYACTSRESLLEWFDGWNERIQRNGFVLAVYEVDRYDLGGRQMAFWGPTARIVHAESFGF